MAANEESKGPADKHIEEQARQQTGNQQIRLKIDERDMKTSYSNAFRSHNSAEEVMIDFGLNIINPTSQAANQPEMVFKVNQRVILNFYTAKRLAIAIGQLIRRHEEQFGPLELNVANRRTGGTGGTGGGEQQS